MFISLNPDAVALGKVGPDVLLSSAPACGFEGIDFPVHAVGSVHEARELSRRAADAGMKWGLFPLPCDFLRVDDDSFRAGLIRLQEVLPVVEAAGCSRTYNHVWPGSDDRDYDRNLAWHIVRLRELASVLSERGIRLGIEFIGPKTLRDTFRYPFIRSLEEALSLIDAVDCDLGLVLDCFHWYTSGGTLRDLESALAGRPVVNVHVNDATAGRTRDEQQDLERRMPLETGLIDATAVLRVLDRLGYDGPVIAEPFNPHRARYAGMPPQEVLAEVGSVMKALFAAAGVRSES